jgi:hypothetical protein
VFGQLETHVLLYRKEPDLHELHIEKELQEIQVTGQDEHLLLGSSGKVPIGQLEAFTQAKFIK